MTYYSSDTFLREYTSQDAIAKYTRATAGFGISYLLDHDYKTIYDKALAILDPDTREGGIRLLEFGCGGGMNLIHLVSVLNRGSIRVEHAIGTDFSPVLIEAAKREAKNYLREEDRCRVDFFIAKNESLIEDLSAAIGTEKSNLNDSFHFIIGVNTIRYCHRAKKELDCARDIAALLVPGGVCVAIDMSNRFPFFKSALKNRFRKINKGDCYIPSLETYTAPFRQVGLEVIRSDHFCWIPHSSGRVMCYVLSSLSPILNAIARSRAMRSLVVLRKPVDVSRA